MEYWLAVDTEHKPKMDSTLDHEFTDGQLASLEEQLSNLSREARVNPSDPPTSIKRLGALRPTFHELANWRFLAFTGSLLVASIAVAAWWWSSSVHTETVAPADPAPRTQAAPTVVAGSSDLAQQLQPIAHDLATLKQAVAQLETRQGQLIRDNENVATQLKASQSEMARNNDIIDQIDQVKATQLRIERDSEAIIERLNASQEQLARVIANASDPKVMPEDPKVMPEDPKVSSEEPKGMPEIPVPRPRRPTNVAQTYRPAPTPARPQAKKQQPSSPWPWSVR
ncbi:outer membrane murein-binding lipoprotein Lpp [Bradyrhizobium sp. GM24.11]